MFQPLFSGHHKWFYYRNVLAGLLIYKTRSEVHVNYRCGYKQQYIEDKQFYKLAIYTFSLHSIYLHTLHITSYHNNVMFISCYHLSSCTHTALYILTLYCFSYQACVHRNYHSISSQSLQLGSPWPMLSKSLI